MKMEDIEEAAQGLVRLSDAEQKEMAELLVDAIGFLHEFTEGAFEDHQWRAVDRFMASIQDKEPGKCA